MKNKIIFAIWDGYDQETKFEGTHCITTAPKIFDFERVELDTEQILCVGDHVRYKHYCTKVMTRYYFPEDNMFKFFCDNIYTGRKE